MYFNTKVLWLSGLSEVLLILSTEVQTLLRPINLVLYFAKVYLNMLADHCTYLRFLKHDN
jgi:hypothetical protein